jgi:quercetin dioxygenase-like cupin family protein
MTWHTIARHRAHRGLMILGIVALAILAAVIRTSAAPQPGPVVEPLARATFVDDVSVQVRTTSHTMAAERSLEDASDVVVARITIPPGGRAPWHAHHGPGILLVTGPGTLTSVISDDCVAREFPAGTALIDPGGTSLHAAVNDGAEEVVLIGIFLGVGNGAVIPADPPADCTF